MKRSIAIPMMLVGVGVSCLVIANTAACNASSQQITQTEQDAFKLAGCVLSEVFAGITDPAAIGAQCVGALPSVIVDVIEDFEAKPVDAGGVGAAPGSHVRELLDEAKIKAAQARASAKAAAAK